MTGDEYEISLKTSREEPEILGYIFGLRLIDYDNHDAEMYDKIIGLSQKYGIFLDSINDGTVIIDDRPELKDWKRQERRWS